MEQKQFRKSKVDEYLDSALVTRDEPVELIRSRKIKSKIELAGETVMRHLMKMAVSTDMTYKQMAEKVSEVYNLNISPENVRCFFTKNPACLQEIARDNKNIAKLRAGIVLEYNAVLVKDIKQLDKQIDMLEEEETIETKDRAKAIGDLIEKKGNLLMKYAKLTGNMQPGQASNVQVNLFQQINNEKSELIDRLKKADFDSRKVTKSNQKIVDTK